MKRYKYTLKKEFTFESSHHLEGLPQGHKCGRNHGHSWKAEVTLSSYVLDEVGMVMDFGVTGAIRDKLDHRNLNEVMHPINPTSENVARFIFEAMTHIILLAEAQEDVVVEKVTILETCTSRVEITYE